MPVPLNPHVVMPVPSRGQRHGPAVRSFNPISAWIQAAAFFSTQVE